MNQLAILRELYAYLKTKGFRVTWSKPYKESQIKGTTVRVVKGLFSTPLFDAGYNSDAGVWFITTYLNGYRLGNKTNGPRSAMLDFFGQHKIEPDRLDCKFR